MSVADASMNFKTTQYTSHSNQATGSHFTPQLVNLNSLAASTGLQPIMDRVYCARIAQQGYCNL